MAPSYLSDAPKFYGVLAVIQFALALWHGIDGWIKQERWLDRYPEFPEVWYDMGLYRFYTYNRWTAVILGLGALICAWISLHSIWVLKREGALLDQVTSIRRNRPR